MKKNIPNIILAIFIIGIFFLGGLAFTPWDDVPWERKATFEKRCKASVGCNHLVELPGDYFNQCVKRCYERSEHRYQLTGDRKPYSPIIKGE